LPEISINKVHGLSNELKEKLTRVRPASLGQASRISGITPAAISVIHGGAAAQPKEGSMRTGLRLKQFWLPPSNRWI
jgi:tRNA U34 5-carboxymethylaminomethyl modifying enzyme MnmG/GidA